MVDASQNLVLTRPVAKEGKEEAFRTSTEQGCNDTYHGSISVDWMDEDSPVGTQEGNKHSPGWFIWRKAARFG